MSPQRILKSNDAQAFQGVLGSGQTIQRSCDSSWEPWRITALARKPAGRLGNEFERRWLNM